MTPASRRPGAKHEMERSSRVGWLLTIAISLLLSARAVAGDTSQADAEAAAKRFCKANLGSGGFSYDEFEGATRERIKPLVSKLLLRTLDSVHDCGRDWLRRQPAGSTDKPPFVDCCVFSASADWPPTSFVLKSSRLQSDGRWRTTVEYAYDSSREHARWPVAVYVVKEAGRYVVDDFEGGLGGPEASHWFVLDDIPSCKDGKWVE
jgi:hypothetical protein